MENARLSGLSPQITILVVLEIVAAGIVFFGGIALTYFGTEKVLGLVHASLGLLGFPVAYGLWRRCCWAFAATMILNLATILYSTLSEIIAFNGVLVTPEALQGSLVGTIIAITISIAIIILLVRPTTRALFR